jgi:hypothetical protein
LVFGFKKNGLASIPESYKNSSRALKKAACFTALGSKVLQPAGCLKSPGYLLAIDAGGPWFFDS